jgi:hypothetical protein
MASAPQLTPPPGTDAPPSGATPTTPTAASPAPGQPSSADGNTKLVIAAVSALRALAQAVPGASPGIQKINDILRNEVMPKLMANQQTGEPQAPPVG